MNTNKVISDIKSSANKQFFLFGEEGFFMDEVFSYVNTQLMEESERAFNFHLLFGKDINASHVIDLARRIPMGSEKQIIVIKEAQFFSEFDELVKYMANPSPSTWMFVFYKKRIDKRKLVFKELLAASNSYESKILREYEMKKWLTGHLYNRKVAYQEDAIPILLEYLGEDLSKLDDAITKIQLNLSDVEKLSAKHVRQYIGVSKEYDVFALQNSLSRRDETGTFRIINYYGSNQKKVSFIPVLANLYSFFGTAMVMKQKRIQSDSGIRDYLGYSNPSAIGNYKNLLRNYSYPQLRKAMHVIKNYDMKVKGYGVRNLSDHSLMKEFAALILN